MAKDWSKASARVQKVIDREVTPILQAACNRALPFFPNAGYVGVREGMGRIWIEVDGLHINEEFSKENPCRFSVYGPAEMVVRSLGIETPAYVNNGYELDLPHLQTLAEAILECGDFLDEFHAPMPDVTTERK